MDGSSSSKRTVEASPQGEPSAKRLNVSIGVETLDCPICFEPLRPPIFQCSVGHCICSSCHVKQLNKKCHLCSVETSFRRCFGMEHVVQSVKVPCSNVRYGCAEKVTYYLKEEHEKACPYAPCFCPESGCGFAGPTKVLLEHLTTQHKCSSTILADSGKASFSLQPGLNIMRCTETSYFFLLTMALEPFGHAISVVCVQPNVTEPKFSCTMDYRWKTTDYRQSTSCHIRSSLLSGGLPTGYDLIIPKGNISDDREGIMLTTTIHQPLSLNRSWFRGNDSTLALETDDEDNVDLNFNRSHLRGKGPTPAFPQRPSFDTDEDDIPLSYRRSGLQGSVPTRAPQRRPCFNIDDDDNVDDGDDDEDDNDGDGDGGDDDDDGGDGDGDDDDDGDADNDNDLPSRVSPTRIC